MASGVVLSLRGPGMAAWLGAVRPATVEEQGKLSNLAALEVSVRARELVDRDPT